jgi:hypothetical protein
MHRNAIVGLTAILVAYLALVHSQTSTGWFGYYHDDSLYWTAAQSLAAGEGYRMASVPGEPPQTKYPVAFPWALSWFWRLDADFPANLSAAVWMVSLSGAAFLGGSFVLLRQFGLGGGAALFLTAVCAVHPVVVHLGGLLLSDVPFMALAVWSLAFSFWALEGRGNSGFEKAGQGQFDQAALWGGAVALALAVALAVVACLVRSIGVTLLGGFVLAALWRRRYRPAAGCLALAAVVAVGTVQLGQVRSGDGGPQAVLSEDTLPEAVSPVAVSPAAGLPEAGLSEARLSAAGPPDVAMPPAATDGAQHGGPSGYQQTMQFYGSYVEFWKLSTPDWNTFSALLSFNFREMLKQPAIAVFNIPASGFVGFGWQLAAVALSFTVVKGMASLAMVSRHPGFAVLGVYAVVVLAWNYTLMDRFFAWALPLFLAGAWWEIGRLARTTAETFRRGAPWLDRAVAAGVMALFAALGLYSGYRYLWVAPTAMAAERAEREGLQADKQQAYQWIRQHSGRGDRFIASEDASLYLFTGRQALRPMAFSTAAFYLQSQQALDRDLERMSDAAAAIGARYWLAAADDYHLESAEEFIQKRAAELLEGRPAVFVSSTGNVRIYDIGGMTAAGGGATSGNGAGAGGASGGGPRGGETPGQQRTPHRDRTSVSAGLGL